jgi:iron complex transport system substrate-binding protein
MKLGISILLLILAGCGRRETPVAAVAGGSYPQRIVCATPGLAEIVFALGAGDRVVGVSDYTVWPPEALNVARIGGWMNPDRERLLMLQPDLILTQGLHEPLAQFAQRHGVRIVHVPTDRLADVIGQIVRVGDMIGATNEARILTEDLIAQMDEIRNRLSGVVPRRTALFLERPEGVFRNLTTVGARTFLSELLDLAGGVNVFADVVGDYPQISREALLVRAPETLIELHSEPVSDARRLQIVSDWQVFGSLPAVQEGRIHFLAGDQVMIPGPRIAETARQMAQILHPEVF